MAATLRACPGVWGIRLTHSLLPMRLNSPCCESAVKFSSTPLRSRNIFVGTKGISKKCATVKESSFTLHRNAARALHEESTGGKDVAKMTFLEKWLSPKEMPERGTLRWYGEMVLVCTVFAITGTSTMVMVRPAVSQGLGLKGSLKDGPWSYRICSLVIMTPLYSAMLVLVGTLAGRHAYFKHFAVKMASRFGIPPELLDAGFHKTAKNFRKW